MFLYAVGVQYGRQFFAGLTSARGLRANLLALAGVLLACAVSLGLLQVTGLGLGHALGLFAGSGTSTPTLQAAIATLLDDLVRQENKTLVFITHDIGLASSLADEIAVLRAGLLVEHGPTRRVLSTPAHDYTRALLADYLDLSTPPLISEAAS